jgi:hypothetical protein
MAAKAKAYHWILSTIVSMDNKRDEDRGEQRVEQSRGEQRRADGRGGETVKKIIT